MKKQNPLFPTQKTDFVDPKTGELVIKYRPGYPRSYRFDASKGNFNLNGEMTLTKKGEALSFIPIAYRLFRDEILGYGKKSWAEFFFANEEGHLCSLLFHGYSVENLSKKTNDLFYDNVNLSQVILTATPVEKVKSSGEGKGNKYFIAEFSYKVLEEKQQEEVKLVGESLNIWRAETLTGDAYVELSVNYVPPIQQLNGSGSAEAIETETVKEEGKITKIKKDVAA